VQQQIREQIHRIPTRPMKLGGELHARKLGAKAAFDPKIQAVLTLKPNDQFILLLRKTLLETRIRQNLTKLPRKNS
jgi:hypothetical protein